ARRTRCSESWRRCMASDTHMHAAEIDHLTRELEEAREIIRDLVDREPICVALRSKYVEVRIDGGTWDDARRFGGLDLSGVSRATGPRLRGGRAGCVAGR